MKGRCALKTAGGEALPAIPCAWSFREDALVFSPDQGNPQALSLRECSGLGGDEYALSLRAGGAVWELTRLGADGPTLLDALRRAWPAFRADALRLTGRGEGKLYRANVGWDEVAPGPGCFLLFEDLLLAAPWGEDLAPHFLSLSERVVTGDEAWGVTVQSRFGSSLTLARLGPKRDEIAKELDLARDGVARAALSVLDSALPALGAADKAALSAAWLPGRLCSVAELSAVAPQAREALDAWIGDLPRKSEAAALRDGASPENTFFALLPGEARDAAPPESGAEGEPSEAALAASSSTGEGPLLWMAVRRENRWFLEALSEGDRATYAFEGGPQLLGLLSMLLCAPQFSREALYLPVEKLTGARAPLSCAARDLPFLRELRARLRARAIHRAPESWRRTLGI